MDNGAKDGSQQKKNLSLLPKEERAKIEEDRQLWFKAHNLYKQGHAVAANYLRCLEPGEHKEDMRRRLNAVRERKLD